MADSALGRLRIGSSTSQVLAGPLLSALLAGLVNRSSAYTVA
jgi:hypothetical protein